MIFPYPQDLVEKFAGPVRRIEVPDGDAGAQMVLGLARDSVNTSLTDDFFPLWVRGMILTANPELDPRDARAVFARCFGFARKNIGFQPDPLVYGKRSIADYVQSPHYTFFRAGLGDCLAHAIALSSLAVALGHGAKIRTLRLDLADPTKRFSHVYAMLAAPGCDWTACDTTTPELEFGEELPSLSLYDPHDLLIADPS